MIKNATLSILVYKVKIYHAMILAAAPRLHLNHCQTSATSTGDAASSYTRAIALCQLILRTFAKYKPQSVADEPIV